MPRLYNEYLAPAAGTDSLRAEADALIGRAFHLLARDHGFDAVDVEHYLTTTLASYASTFRLAAAMKRRRAEREARKPEQAPPPSET